MLTEFTHTIVQEWLWKPLLCLFFAIAIFTVSARVALSEAASAPKPSQIRCRANMSYSWQRTDEEKVRTIQWTILETTGSDEASAKQRLKELAAKQEVKALTECEKKHHNLSGCMAAKYSGMSNVLRTLSFTARNTLEEAIAEDCASEQGECLKVTTTEAVCEAVEEEVTEEKGAENEKGEEEKR